METYSVEELPYMINRDSIVKMDTPEYSNWRCWVFGATNGSGILWTPVKGQEPNWFHRKMQHLCFGCKWEKLDS